MCHTKVRWIEKRIDMMNEIKLVAVMGSVFMFLGCANAMDRINQLQSEGISKRCRELSE